MLFTKNISILLLAHMHTHVYIYRFLGYVVQANFNLFSFQLHTNAGLMALTLSDTDYVLEIYKEAVPALTEVLTTKVL